MASRAASLTRRPMVASAGAVALARRATSMTLSALSIVVAPLGVPDPTPILARRGAQSPRRTVRRPRTAALRTVLAWLRPPAGVVRCPRFSATGVHRPATKLEQP